MWIVVLQPGIALTPEKSRIDIYTMLRFSQNYPYTCFKQIFPMVDLKCVRKLKAFTRK